MMRRLATTDSLLVVLSCVVLVLAWWPAGPQRQEFQLIGADGTAKTYSLPLDDPRLAAVRRQHKAEQYLPPARLAVARWNHELASFYAQHTCDGNRGEAASRCGAGPVATVSFEDVLDTNGKPIEPTKIDQEKNTALIANPASRDHWLAVQEQANQAIALAERKPHAVPPVVMGILLEDHRSSVAFFFALAGGLMLACGYLQWRQHCPAVELEASAESETEVRLAFASESSGPLSDGKGNSGGNEITVPARSLRVRQPLAVLARRASLTGLVIAALLSIIS